MCGICGFSGSHNKELIEKMASAISHRGPDQRDFYFGQNISLAHRRLSIIDLSEKAKQPLSNENGTIQLICNGEIYNYLSIREKLEKRGHRFYSNSDNEVIVHAYEEFGEECVKHLRGMFAFAIWDDRRGKLLLARDRIGIKPLYYITLNGNIIFASEIKAILENSDIKRKVNYNAYPVYLTFQYLPFNETMFEGIQKLPPAHILVYKTGRIELKRYWNLPSVGLTESFSKNDEADCIQHVKKLLEESVKMRLMSDVPLGILLSGGVDSSSLVALMSKFSEQPINTFSIGFNQPDNELKYANIVAQHFQTKHREYIFQAKNLLEVLPEIIWHMDEPIADGGLMATYWVADFVKDYVKVILVGEGADEVFAGYPWHRLSSPYLRQIPDSIKRRLWFYLNSSCRRKGTLSFATLRKNFPELSLILVKKAYFLERILAFEIKHQLPNQLLMKVDKMTMAHSVEARVPYLDHRLVEYLISLAPDFKIKGVTNKYILRKAMTDLLPPEIVWRKKHGLMVPLAQWLRGELRNFALWILTQPESHARRFYSEKEIKNFFQKRKNRFIDIENIALLWRLLVFEIWYMLYIKKLSLNSVREIILEKKYETA